MGDALRQHAAPRLRLADGPGAGFATALEQAIELNGAAVDANRQAFAWGRRAAVFPDQVAAIAGRWPASPPGK
jgi:hypothetical protein